MKRRDIFAVIAHALVIGALVIFVLGDALGSTLVLEAAGVMFGFGLILAGIQTRRTGQVELIDPERMGGDDLKRVPPSTWGIVMISIGTVLILFVVALLFRLDRAFERSLSRFGATSLGQSVVWFIIGGAAILYGIGGLRADADDSLWGIVRSIPTRVLGLVFFIFGLVIVSLTVVWLISPSWFDTVLATLWNWLGALL
ncbi:MAG TPA: hypothetical protein VFD70_24530 [Anaerolineae bacterium]|nr:hypothetical protein [Anaerolineae bacterium]